jgi:hypothetical protein
MLALWSLYPIIILHKTFNYLASISHLQQNIYRNIFVHLLNFNLIDFINAIISCLYLFVMDIGSG